VRHQDKPKGPDIKYQENSTIKNGEQIIELQLWIWSLEFALSYQIFLYLLYKPLCRANILFYKP